MIDGECSVSALRFTVTNFSDSMPVRFFLKAIMYKAEQSLVSKDIRMGTFVGLKEKLVQHFGPRQILAILAYGTRMSNAALTDRRSDYDITIVFRNYPDRNLPRLPKNVDVTVLFWPDIKLCGAEYFRLYNHGEFYIIVLSGAVALHGVNPFKKLAKELPMENVLRSLREQILLHCAKLATIAMESSPEKSIRNIRKYSFRISQNFYFLLRQRVSYREFVDAPYERWISYFAKEAEFPSVLLEYLRRLEEESKSVTIKEVLMFAYHIKQEVLAQHEAYT